MRAAYSVTPAAVYELVHVCQARAVRPHINVIATAIACTAGPRHSNLGPPLAAGLNPTLALGNVVQTSLRTWLGRAGIGADWTEDVTRLTNLHRFKAVIFASTSRGRAWLTTLGHDPVLYEMSGARRDVSANSPSESAIADCSLRRSAPSSRLQERARRTARHTDWHRWERRRA